MNISNIDLSVLITIILGFATCISPAIVALINNFHSQKMEKLRLQASLDEKRMELQFALHQKKFDLTYGTQYQCFLHFLSCVSDFISHHTNLESYSNLISAYSQVLMQGIRWDKLSPIMEHAQSAYMTGDLSHDELEQLQLFLASAGEIFYEELSKSRSKDIQLSP